MTIIIMEDVNGESTVLVHRRKPLLLEDMIQDIQVAEWVDNQLAELVDSPLVRGLQDIQQLWCWVGNSFQVLVGNFREHWLVDSHLQRLADSLLVEL